MKVKLVNLAYAAGLIDPVTRRRPFIDPTTGEPIESADVPETNFWIRRVSARELVRVDVPAPSGSEPIPPLTTRGGK